MSSADTTVSAYDLLSKEDREALDWVRDHGGLDALCSELPKLAYRASLVGSVYNALDIDPDEPGAAMLLASEVKRLRDDHDALLWMDEHGGMDEVREHWKGYVPARWLEKAKRAYERKRDRLKAHAWELERKCGERRDRIRELERERDRLRAEADAMCPRLMPEGMEWPRFEDGEPVRIGDRVSDVDVRSIVFSRSGVLMSDCTSVPGWGTWRSYKEPIKHPAPKVLDADGVEIRVGDVLYSVDAGVTVSVIGFGGGYVAAHDSDGCLCRIQPDAYTHRAPVLAADGKPLREGETVWSTAGEFDGGRTVKSVYVDPDEPPYATFEERQEPWSCLCCCITHERPDSWERLWMDMHPADETECVGLDRDEFVLRARALAGDA